MDNTIVAVSEVSLFCKFSYLRNTKSAGYGMMQEFYIKSIAKQLAMEVVLTDRQALLHNTNLLFGCPQALYQTMTALVCQYSIDFLR